MINMKKYIIGVMIAAGFLAACEKKVDPIDTFYVTVDYRSQIHHQRCNSEPKG